MTITRKRFSVSIAALVLFLHLSARAQVFTALHSLAFTNGTGPVASLLLSGNTLYGTTRIYGGGTAGGEGSIFRMSIDGSGFTNLHTFSAIVPEGGNMNGSLVLSGNTLYTTATFGGGSNYGCVIAMNIDGSGLTNRFNFPATDSTFPVTNNVGAYPDAGLILQGGELYGSANSGGAYGWGTLFALSTNGTGFANLHNFNFTNGQYPSADLMFADGALYGTTPGGGTFHNGTIFKINTNGTGYTNFYSFSPDSGPDFTNGDGAFPTCNLVLSGTNLYGTAGEGGKLGGGTIFAIDTNGTTFTVLHSFATTNGPAGINAGGARPKSGLALSGNVLYGTTFTGGSSGSGTLFKINTDGTGFSTLYEFSATNGAGPNTSAGTNNDGAHPVGGLLYTNGVLYGTASDGGMLGLGSIFKITFAPTLFIARVGTNAVVTWPSNVVGFNLETTTNLAGTWDPLAGQYAVTNGISGRQRFYRLKAP